MMQKEDIIMECCCSYFLMILPVVYKCFHIGHNNLNLPNPFFASAVFQATFYSPVAHSWGELATYVLCMRWRTCKTKHEADTGLLSWFWLTAEFCLRSIFEFLPLMLNGVSGEFNRESEEIQFQKHKTVFTVSSKKCVSVIFMDKLLLTGYSYYGFSVRLADGWGK